MDPILVTLLTYGIPALIGAYAQHHTGLLSKILPMIFPPASAPTVPVSVPGLPVPVPVNPSLAPAVADLEKLVADVKGLLAGFGLPAAPAPAAPAAPASGIGVTSK